MGTEPPLSLTSQLSQAEGPPTLAGLLPIHFISAVHVRCIEEKLDKALLESQFNSDNESTITIPRTDKTLN